LDVSVKFINIDRAYPLNSKNNTNNLRKILFKKKQVEKPCGIGTLVRERNDKGNEQDRYILRAVELVWKEVPFQLCKTKQRKAFIFI
jgi:hypothetical protein